MPCSGCSRLKFKTLQLLFNVFPIPASVGASLATVVESERPSAASEDEQTLAARAQPGHQVLQLPAFLATEFFDKSGRTLHLSLCRQHSWSWQPLVSTAR